MMRDGCDDDSDTWRSRTSSTYTACDAYGGNCHKVTVAPTAEPTTFTTISPDRVAGINGNEASTSLWNTGNPTIVQWNQPGAVYGCWY
jgi:hypothetical protein